MAKKKKTSIEYPSCPYCGQKSKLLTRKELLGDTSDYAKDKKYFVCNHYPVCNTYIKAISKKGKWVPAGTMADIALREKRNETHKTFDKIWKSGLMSRVDAYKWLGDIFGYVQITNSRVSKHAHISNLNKRQCDIVIEKSKEFLSKRKTHKSHVA